MGLGPDLVRAGIWRPLSVEPWRDARIAAVRPLTEVEGSTGLLRAQVDVQRAAGADGPLTVEVHVAGSSAHATLAAGDRRCRRRTRWGGGSVVAAPLRRSAVLPGRDHPVERRYESEDLYDSCGELGLLVWQDFLFACAAYAEDEPLLGEVIAGAREAVTLRSAHPSLAIWTGCNENIWGHEDWDLKAPLAGRTWGWGYYTDVLPAIVSELDPHKPYCPGSPHSMSTQWRPNDPLTASCTSGTSGTSPTTPPTATTCRGSAPSSASRVHPPGRPLTRSIHDNPLTPDSPGMLVHQKAEDGNGKPRVRRSAISPCSPTRSAAPTRQAPTRSSTTCWSRCCPATPRSSSPRR